MDCMENALPLWCVTIMLFIIRSAPADLRYCPVGPSAKINTPEESGAPLLSFPELNTKPCGVT
jgi:hypothetical protein